MLLSTLLLPAAAAAPLSKGARALTSPLSGCTSYTSVSGSDAETSWCVTTCAVSDCPEAMCKCADGAGAQADGASAPATPEVPGATTPMTPEVPGAAAPVTPEVPGVAPPSSKNVKAPSGKEAMEMKGIPTGGKDVKPAKIDKDAEHTFDKLIIGYWGSGPYTPFEDANHEEDGATMGEALKQGYNVICLAFADRFQTDGSFAIDTDMCPTRITLPTGVTQEEWAKTHPCAPTKANVSKSAGVSESSWRYMLSFGGAAGPGPSFRGESENEPEKFAEGFVQTYLKIKEEYGFDGIDIDVESSLGSDVLGSFREIFKKLHKMGELISFAPETPSLNPGQFPIFQAGAMNSYAPMVASDVIDAVSWIAPQMYNDDLPFEGDTVQYVTSLQESHKLDWEGTEIEVKIPADKIVLGFPATPAAAPVRKIADWEEPDALIEYFKQNEELQKIKGVMTWSVGHDYSSGWKWIKAVKQIWG
jgi:chitinase